MYKLNDVVGYFMRNDWKFHDDNLVNMYESLSPTDRIIFNCNIKELNWDRYLIIMGIGIRKYIVKDGLKNTHYGRKKNKVLLVVHYIVTPLYLYSLWKFFTFCLSFVSKVFLFFYTSLSMLYLN